MVTRTKNENFGNITTHTKIWFLFLKIIYSVTVYVVVSPKDYPAHSDFLPHATGNDRTHGFVQAMSIFARSIYISRHPLVLASLDAMEPNGSITMPVAPCSYYRPMTARNITQFYTLTSDLIFAWGREMHTSKYTTFTQK